MYVIYKWFELNVKSQIRVYKKPIIRNIYIYILFRQKEIYKNKQL